MFCNNCSCELPTVAKFCVRCGSRVETQGAINARPGSFCVNCGKPYSPSYKFCNYCGHPVSIVQAESEPTAAAGDEIALRVQALSEEETRAAILEVAASGAQQIESAPYATFTMQLLASTVLFSCATFTVTDAIGRNRLGDTATGFLVVTLLAGFWLSVAGRRTWRRVVAFEPATDVGLKRRRRRVLINTTIMAVLFVAVSATVGSVIGRSGAEAAQLQADLIQLDTLGKQVSKARSPEGRVTIDWYIQSYKSIEPNVDRLDVLLHRLVSELSAYNERFPDQGRQTSESISGMNTGIRRMALLKQQISVAKKIEGLSQSEQLIIWGREMQPLLDQEDALDKPK